MKLKEVKDSLSLKVYCGEEFLERDVQGGYVSDLLSDVMGHASEGEVWITLQSHLNVIAIASLKELAAVILVKDIEPGEGVIEKAIEEEIPVFGTSDSTFEIGGRLYNFLNR